MLNWSILVGAGRWEEALLVEAEAWGTAASIPDALLRPEPETRKEPGKESLTSWGELAELELLPKPQSTVAAWEKEGGGSKSLGGGAMEGDGVSRPDIADWTASW